MMVYHQEASGIAAKDASSKPWMTKHSHLHVQEEVKVMQMMGFNILRAGPGVGLKLAGPGRARAGK